MLEIASSVGLPAQSVLWVRVTLTSVERYADGGARARVSIRVDSRHARCFAIELMQLGNRGIAARRTRFELGTPTLDELGVGGCAPSQLGPWLAAAATTLGIHWTIGLVRSNLRGAKRDALAAWLTS